MNDAPDILRQINSYAILYALDALPPAERKQIEWWLEHGDFEDTSHFRRQVAAARSTMTLLSSLTAGNPPPRLRRRVLAGLSRNRSHIRRGVGGSAPARPRRKVAALFVTIVVMGGAVGIVVGNREGETPGAEQIIDASDARAVSTAAVGGGTVAALVSESLRSVVVESHGLEDVAREGSEFQLWLVSTAEPSTVDAGRLDDRRVITEIEGVDALMVTVEPAGGSKQPTQRPVAVIWLA